VKSVVTHSNGERTHAKLFTIYDLFDHFLILAIWPCGPDLRSKWTGDGHTWSKSLQQKRNNKTHKSYSNSN